MQQTIRRRTKIRALIVDDEPFARERVRQLLEGDPEVEITGECGDGLQAVAMINVFLWWAGVRSRKKYE